MTEKQTIFAIYLLNQLGITEKPYLDDYLNYLEAIYGKVKWGSRSNGTSYQFYSASECIECLLDEITLKKNKNQIIKKNTNEITISATDLSNFRYCPVGFSINKSFEIEKPNGQEYTEIGKLLHEELLLIRKIKNIKSQEHFDDFKTDNDPVLSNIINSKLVFCGHSAEKRIFTNEIENYSGSPDYIFTDSEGHYFVVEEKFHKKTDFNRLINYIPNWDPNYYNPELDKRIEKASTWANSSVLFYPNHELQLVSYIRNIQDFKIDYGYLIYWYYDLKYGLYPNHLEYGLYPYIHRIEIKKLEINENTENQYSLYMSQLRDLLKIGKLKFEKDKMHPNKCAACVVSKYCGHKTGLIDEFSFPYNLNNLKIFQVEFPAELIKH